MDVPLHITMYLSALRMGVSRNCFLYARASLTPLVAALRKFMSSRSTACTQIMLS